MNFLESPFIPKRRISLAMIDRRMSHSFKKRLLHKQINCIEVDSCNSLYEAISGHPDIQCHPLGLNKVLIAPNASESLKNQLIQHNFELVVGNTTLEGNYPNNIAYNVARIGGVAFHNIRYTDPVLREELVKQGVRLVHVNQGYTKCSVAIVGEDSIITADKGIATAALENKLDVLYIRPGYISLKELNYGFIGGTCGLTSKDEITFIGDITRHLDYGIIKEYILSKGKRISCLKEGCLSDYGGIIPLMEEN